MRFPLENETRGCREARVCRPASTSEIMTAVSVEILGQVTVKHTFTGSAAWKIWHPLRQNRVSFSPVVATVRPTAGCLPDYAARLISTRISVQSSVQKPSSPPGRANYRLLTIPRKLPLAKPSALNERSESPLDLARGDPELVEGSKGRARHSSFPVNHLPPLLVTVAASICSWPKARRP